MDVTKAILITIAIGVVFLLIGLIAAIIWPILILLCVFFVVLMIIKAEKTPGYSPGVFYIY